MTLNELIERLQELAAEHDGDETVVQIAYQRSWPLRGGVANVTFLEAQTEPESDDDDDYSLSDDTSLDHSNKPAVWLAVDDYVPYDDDPYAPAAAWED